MVNLDNSCFGLGRDADINAAAADALHRLGRPQVWEQVANQLRAAIVSERIKPGTFIRLHDTASRLGVSITPIREALLKLSGEGLVQREPHRGYLVLPVTRNDLRDIRWLQGIVCIELTVESVGPISESQITELEYANEVLTRAVEIADAQAMAEADLVFYETVGRISKRTVLTRVLADTRRHLHARAGVAEPEWGVAAIDGNRQLIAALRRGHTYRADFSQLPSAEVGAGDSLAPPPPATRRSNPSNGRNPRISDQSDVPRTAQNVKAIGVGQLRSNMTGYLDSVAKGETVEVVRKGKVAARIVRRGHRSIAARGRGKSAESSKRRGATPVSLGAFRTRAGHFLDLVGAGETLEIIRDSEVIGVVIPAPDD